MAITYDAGTNIITVTGYTEETPCTFEDIYQADVAGGWGVVSKIGDFGYFIEGNLTIGDGGSTITWFADTQKAVQLGTSGAGKRLQILNGNNDPAKTHFRLGTEDVLTDGCYLRIYHGSTPADRDAHWSGELEIYGSTIIKTGGRWIYIGYYTGTIIKVEDSNIQLGRIPLYLTQSWIRVNGYITTFRFNGVPTVTFDDVLADGSTSYCFELNTSGNVATSNFYGRDRTYVAWSDSGFSGNLYLINPDISPWAFLWHASSTGKIYRQYEFDLKVEDEQDNPLTGYSIDIINNAGSVVYSGTTDVSGVISCQTISYGYYDQAHGDTLQSYSPFTLEINGGATYLNYTGVLDLDKKTDLVINMVDISTLQADITSIKSTVDTFLDASISTRASQSSMDAIGTNVSNILQVQKGRWKIDSNTLTLYDADTVTPLYQFKLMDDSSVATMTDVYERMPV